MRNAVKYPAVIIAAALFLGGCAHYSTDIGALAGVSTADLQKARSSGRVKVFPMTREKAFDSVLAVLKENSLTVFQQSRRKGIIVAIGFPKQTDTTRVGIFFEPAGDGGTKVTLSSLSTSALMKAEAVIFGGPGGAAIIR